jgi:hypothetical protein
MFSLAKVVNVVCSWTNRICMYGFIDTIQVGELFKIAGNALGQLGELTLQLQPSAEQAVSRYRIEHDSCSL